MLFTKYFCFVSFILLIAVADGKKLKAKLVTASKCNVPASRLNPNPPVQYNITTKKVNRQLTVFSASFNNTHKYGPVTFAGRAFQIKQNTAKDLVFKLENISCHNPFVSQIIKQAHFNFDKDCYFPAGGCRVEDLDLNNYRWILEKTLTTSGKYAYEFEFSDPKGVCACVFIVFDIIIQP